MAQNFNHVSHIKSKLTRDIVPEEFYGLTPTADNSDAEGSSPIKLNLAKRPTADKLIDGEIAVNYKKGHETLTIKNDEGEIVGFVNENEFNEAQEIMALGLAKEKDERIKYQETMNASVTTKLDKFDEDIERLELGISSSLNDLNSRINAMGDVSGDSINNINNKVNELSETVEELSQSVNEQFESVTEDMGELSDAIDRMNGDIEDINNSIENINETISENELVISASLNDLNERIIGLDEDSDERFETIESNLNEIEHSVSSAINDINDRINESNDELNDSIYLVDSKITELSDSVDDSFEEVNEKLTKLENDTENDISYGGDRYVDLGLPSGILWGKYNIGGFVNLTEYGLYFAWGETEGYEGVEAGVNRTFDAASYKWKWTQDPNNEPLKYNATDNMNVLSPLNDAAKNNWRGIWRMPTNDDVNELLGYTTQHYENGMYVFTSTINGNKLYFPCAGVVGNGIVSDEGAAVYVWTKNLNQTNNKQAYYLQCYGDTCALRYNGSRESGMSVRAVAIPRKRS